MNAGVFAIGENASMTLAPYPTLIVDNFFEPMFFNWLLAEKKALKKYHFYNDEHTKKITSVPGDIPPRFLKALKSLAQPSLFYGRYFPEWTEPDLSFYGAGVSIMRPGDFLKPHVDHATHPNTGFTRMYNALLYLTECKGGELRLIGADTEFRLKPKPNRVVFFQSHGNAVHAVEPVLEGERIALSVYFYSRTFKPERANKKAAFL